MDIWLDMLFPMVFTNRMSLDIEDYASVTVSTPMISEANYYNHCREL